MHFKVFDKTILGVHNDIRHIISVYVSNSSIIRVYLYINVIT